MQEMGAHGSLEINSSQKMGLAFGGIVLTAGLVLATLVFPFWNLIREDVFEEVVILTNVDGICYVETLDNIPKTIENCNLAPGETVNIKYGEGLAWATVVTPEQ